MPCRDCAAQAMVPASSLTDYPLFQGHVGPGQVLHHLQVLLQGCTGKISDTGGAALQRDRSCFCAVRPHLRGSF